MQKINIMTSCDEKLIEYVFLQLKSIQMNLKDKQVDFYLFYHNICEDILNALEKYCLYLGNINFIRIYIENIEPYKLLTDPSEIMGESNTGRWPCEAYFSFLCHNFLPKTVERILYIDAGDIIFTGDIDEFYNCDFSNRFIIGTANMYKSPNRGNLFYKEEDLMDYNSIMRIRMGLINSGSYMINIKKFNEENITIDKYYDVMYKTKEILKNENHKYHGDQGLLSLAFVGNITFYIYNQNLDLYYRPYNHMTNQYFKPLAYTPKIIHFIRWKPWNGKMLYLEELVLKEKLSKYEIIFFEYWYKLERIVYLEKKLLNI
ncbi:hypothetical protein AN640_01850 [Candidatus Epulonipiscium fishelsonii]|uniref:Uncharacterized protein n=1 Tax=Candidatus Epulonipiscium fishelsonii TaxID=77094 RepID=A0ACC8XAH2_9FIRM|nr:hypothetical protein AN640_01850 [Epulopiscium sp. SCG-D08WGA-EpuloA1]